MRRWRLNPEGPCRGPGRHSAGVPGTAAITLALALVARGAGAESPAPFEHFRQLGDSALANAQLHLVPLATPQAAWPELLLTVAAPAPPGRAGPDSAAASAGRAGQNSAASGAPAPTHGVVMPGQGRLPDVWAMLHLPTRRAARQEGGPPAARVTVTAGEMRDVLACLDRFPGARLGFVDSTDAYLLTLRDGVGAPAYVYETTLTRRAMGTLGRALAVAAESSAAAVEAFGSIACASDDASAPPADEVTGSVHVEVDRLAFDASRRELNCRLRVTNRAARPIAGPIDVAVRARPAGVRLLGPDSFACRLFERMVPVVRMPAAEALPPGGTIERTIRLSNPRQRDVRFEFRVFAGGVDL